MKEGREERQEGGRKEGREGGREEGREEEGRKGGREEGKKKSCDSLSIRKETNICEKPKSIVILWVMLKKKKKRYM